MPVGALIAIDDRIVGRARWHGAGNGLLGHPEHLVLTGADSSISWSDRRAASLYTTLEPCLMCMGAAMSFFLGRIVFAAPAPADGAADIARVWRPRLGHPQRSGSYALPAIQGGLMESQSRELIARWLAAGADGPEADFARLTLGS